MRQTPTSNWQMGAVAFVDVVGSTGLILSGDRSGPDRLIGFLGDATKLAEKLGALAVRVMGDAVMAVFASPTDAAAFASGAASRAATLAKRGGKQSARFQIRVGIATGELAVRPEAVGVPVNLAARLASLAEPSTVLCDETTMVVAHRLPGRWRSTKARPKLPGLPKLMPAYESSLANGHGARNGSVNE